MMLIIDLVQITHFQKKKHVDFQQEVFYRASLNIFCQKRKKEKRKENYSYGKLLKYGVLNVGTASFSIIQVCLNPCSSKRKIKATHLLKVEM